MSVVVETKQGKLEGVASDGLHIFRGIPFAKPPVADLRFRSPQASESWRGVRSASEFGPAAPQRDLPVPFAGWDVGQRDEDCLYLNVATPAADAGRRPVMVWIHGGAYILGAGSQKMYDPEALTRRGDVVVVTINYRLGPFGFLHLDDIAGEDFGASGNAGTEDQIAALRWVRDNIAAFGGDPGNVTIFGESAGGMSVGTLMGAPAAAGLFQRAIPQSGAADAINTAERASDIAARFLQVVGIAPGDVSRLRELTTEQILAGQDALAGDVLGSGDGQMPFQPVVDGKTLPRPPIEAIRAGLSANVDVLIGTTRDEWNLFSMMNPAQSTLDDDALTAQLIRLIGPEAKGLVDGYRAVRGANTPMLAIYNAIQTDRIFRIPAVRLAEAQLAHPARLYNYLFTWEAPLPQLGACHGIDIPFVFGGAKDDTVSLFLGPGDESKVLADNVMDAWVAFARAGDPSHANLAEWPRYDARSRPTMELGKSCQILEAPQDAERALWDDIL